MSSLLDSEGQGKGKTKAIKRSFQLCYLGYKSKTHSLNAIHLNQDYEDEI